MSQGPFGTKFKGATGLEGSSNVYSPPTREQYADRAAGAIMGSIVGDALGSQQRPQQHCQQTACPADAA